MIKIANNLQQLLKKIAMDIPPSAPIPVQEPGSSQGYQGVWDGVKNMGTGAVDYLTNDVPEYWGGVAKDLGLDKSFLPTRPNLHPGIASRALLGAAARSHGGGFVSTGQNVGKALQDYQARGLGGMQPPPAPQGFMDKMKGLGAQLGTRPQIPAPKYPPTATPQEPGSSQGWMKRVGTAAAAGVKNMGHMAGRVGLNAGRVGTGYRGMQHGVQNMGHTTQPQKPSNSYYGMEGIKSNPATPPRY